MRLQKPEDTSKAYVIVWDPHRQKWAVAHDSHLTWFAQCITRIEYDIQHGYDHRPGMSDETMRLPLDAARTALANLHNVLACARRKIEDIRKK